MRRGSGPRVETLKDEPRHRVRLFFVCQMAQTIKLDVLRVQRC